MNRIACRDKEISGARMKYNSQDVKDRQSRRTMQRRLVVYLRTKQDRQERSFWSRNNNRARKRQQFFNGFVGICPAARLENSWSSPASKSCRADSQNAHKITDTGEQSKIYWPFGGNTICYRLRPRRLIFGCVMVVAFLPFRAVMIHFMSALILSG